MINEEIKEVIDVFFKNTPTYIGVGYGYKVKNDISTNEEAIVFYVPKKKPLPELSKDEILPSDDIVLSDRILKTDVIEVGNIKLFECNDECYDFINNPPANRLYRRPVQGGISLTSRNQLGYVGTLGFLALDTETDALVGVTCNHVLIKDAFYTGDRNILGPIQNEYDIVDEGSVTPDSVYQPGEYSNPPPYFLVGEVVRYVPMHLSESTGVNKVDVALLSLNCPPTIDFSISYKQFGFTGNTAPMPFATTSELNGLLSSNPMLYSSGRTTGVKEGQPCPLRVAYIGVSVPVGEYGMQGEGYVVNFEDCIVFTRPYIDPSPFPNCLYPVTGGDSGSALIADFNGVRKIIGVVFAGSDSSGIGIACRIDHIASELGIKAWDGSVKPVVDSKEIVTIPGKSYTKKYNCDGDYYWQVGLTRLNNDCN